jgi:hypothetical protein
LEASDSTIKTKVMREWKKLTKIMRNSRARVVGDIMDILFSTTMIRKGAIGVIKRREEENAAREKKKADSGGPLHVADPTPASITPSLMCI